MDDHLHQKRVSAAEAHRFASDCLQATGATTADHADQQAALLVAADQRGHYSHGLNRLHMYVNELRAGTADGRAVPHIGRESPATAWVDARNALGAVAGNWCMDLAIDKARRVGVGLVSCRRANHYGMAGWYAMRAERQGLIGLTMCNTSPVVAPTRSRQAALGTNPIAFAAPASEGGGFQLDMATSAVALGKVELLIRKGEPCPVGWAQDSAGRPATDPQVAWDAACLMPLGGAEETAGYKGYGLAAMAEVMCGVLAGAAFGTNVRKWTLDGGDLPADLGQMFMAVDPSFFASGFAERMTEFTDMLRALEPVDVERPVLVAGDPERRREAENRQNGGIVYHGSQLESSRRLAEELGVQPMMYLEEV